MTSCSTCGELLPHSCPPIITTRRDLRYKSGHRVTVTDRAAAPAPAPPAVQQPVTVLLYPAVSPYASLLLGNELDADGNPPYEWRREWLAEWDGVA